MNVENCIKEIIGKQGLSYLADDWSRTNLYAFKRSGKDGKVTTPKGITLPAVMCEIAPSGDFKVAGGRFIETDNVLINWLQEMPYDYTAEQIETLLVAARTWAQNFIELCNKSGYFKPVTDVHWYRTQDKLDANLFVFTLELSITELTGNCFSE